mgnify:FL=1
MTDENKLISERKNKFEKIKKHQNPYPNNFKKNISAVDILDLYKSKDKTELEKVDLSYAISGRLLTIRVMGNSTFANLHDETGKIQIYLSKKTVGDNQYDILKNLDLGDIIGVEGSIFKTKIIF